jgi:hypothetical protein
MSDFARSALAACTLHVFKPIWVYLLVTNPKKMQQGRAL